MNKIILISFIIFFSLSVSMVFAGPTYRFQMNEVVKDITPPGGTGHIETVFFNETISDKVYIKVQLLDPKSSYELDTGYYVDPSGNLKIVINYPWIESNEYYLLPNVGNWTWEGSLTVGKVFPFDVSVKIALWDYNYIPPTWYGTIFIGRFSPNVTGKIILEKSYFNDSFDMNKAESTTLSDFAIQFQGSNYGKKIYYCYDVYVMNSTHPSIRESLYRTAIVKNFTLEGLGSIETKENIWTSCYHHYWKPGNYKLGLSLFYDADCGSTAMEDRTYPKTELDYHEWDFYVPEYRLLNLTIWDWGGGTAWPSVDILEPEPKVYSFLPSAQGVIVLNNPYNKYYDFWHWHLMEGNATHLQTVDLPNDAKNYLTIGEDFMMDRNYVLAPYFKLNGTDNVKSGAQIISVSINTTDPKIGSWEVYHREPFGTSIWNNKSIPAGTQFKVTVQYRNLNIFHPEEDETLYVQFHADWEASNSSRLFADYPLAGPDVVPGGFVYTKVWPPSGASPSYFTMPSKENIDNRLLVYVNLLSEYQMWYDGFYVDLPLKTEPPPATGNLSISAYLDSKEVQATATIKEIQDVSYVTPFKESLAPGIYNVMAVYQNYTQTQTVTITANQEIKLNFNFYTTKYQCSDGIDNDGDGKIDYPNDPDCSDTNDNNEGWPGGAGISFQLGWNMISLPINTTISASELKNKLGTTNTVWYYNPVSKRYESTSNIEPGKGYWLKFDSSKTIILEGNPVNINDFPQLKTGWNQISGLSSSVSFDSIKGSCSKTAGPWKYNPTTRRYESASTLDSGYGYWIKVGSDCKLGTSKYENISALASINKIEVYESGSGGKIYNVYPLAEQALIQPGEYRLSISVTISNKGNKNGDLFLRILDPVKLLDFLVIPNVSTGESYNIGANVHDMPPSDYPIYINVGHIEKINQKSKLVVDETKEIIIKPKTYAEYIFKNPYPSSDEWTENLTLPIGYKDYSGEYFSYWHAGGQAHADGASISLSSNRVAGTYSIEYKAPYPGGVGKWAGPEIEVEYEVSNERRPFSVTNFKGFIDIFEFKTMEFSMYFNPQDIKDMTFFDIVFWAWDYDNLNPGGPLTFEIRPNISANRQWLKFSIDLKDVKESLGEMSSRLIYRITFQSNFAHGDVTSNIDELKFIK